MLRGLAMLWGRGSGRALPSRQGSHACAAPTRPAPHRRMDTKPSAPSSWRRRYLRSAGGARAARVRLYAGLRSSLARLQAQPRGQPAAHAPAALPRALVGAQAPAPGPPGLLTTHRWSPQTIRPKLEAATRQ